MPRPRLPREHGTPRGYDQHIRNHEEACEACKASRRVPEPKIGPAKHGTVSGYHKHRRNDEKACEECLTAMREWQRDYVAAHPEYKEEHVARQRRKRREWRALRPQKVKCTPGLGWPVEPTRATAHAGRRDGHGEADSGD